MPKKSVNIANKLVPWLFLILIGLLWQLVVDRGLIQRFILPSPWDILATLLRIFPEIKVHLMTTIREALLGLFIAVILSLTLALLMDSFPLMKKAVYPVLIVSQTIPAIVLAPLFALWFGFGELPKIIIVVLVCFFPVVISLMDGLNSVDPDMINLFRSMGAGQWQLFRHLKLAASMTNFFSGLRIAATYSIMGAVIAEWLGGITGLGVYMIRVKHSYALDKVFAVILIIVALSMLIFKGIAWSENLLMPWRRLLNKNQSEVNSNGQTK